MRLNESELVMGALERLGLRLKLVDASETFYNSKTTVKRIVTAEEIDPEMSEPLKSCIEPEYGARFSIGICTREGAIEFHAFAPLEALPCVTNGIPLGCSLLLLVDTVNCVQTLKAKASNYRRHVHARCGSGDQRFGFEA
jgi:hypothetical protein